MIEPNPELDASLLHLVTYESQSEYQLLKTLQQPPWIMFSQDCFIDELLMFQSHFILFNALYRLRDQAKANAWFDMEIHSLGIYKIAIDDLNAKRVTLAVNDLEHQSVCQDDPLARYYLDWQNLEQTSLEDVQALLNDFWGQMASARPIKKNIDLDYALTVLGFTCLPDAHSLKKQFKKRAFQLHPDQGGNHKAFTELRDAFQTIKNAQVLT